MLRQNQPILLKRLREVKKPRFNEENNLIDPGSLVVFAYRSEDKDDKNKIRELLKRAPCIRLGRAVYAFCQEYSHYDRKADLVDARRFRMLWQANNGNLRVFGRMVIVNVECVPALLEKLTARIDKGINDVVAGYEALYQRAMRGEIGMKDLREEQSKLERRFNLVKKLARFYEKWLRIDFSKIITKPYPIIRKVRSLNAEHRAPRAPQTSLSLSVDQTQ